jgi:hypothetical protein
MDGLTIRGEVDKQDVPCKFVFSRAYDLRRHLTAYHELEYPKEVIDGWVRKRKI